MLYLLSQALQRLSPHLRLYVYELMVQPIGAKPLLSVNLAKNLSLVELARTAPEIDLMPAPHAVKMARFDQGGRCLCVYRKGQPIGYLWFGMGRHNEDEVRCDYLLSPATQSIFDYDLFVFPEHRMGLGFLGVWHCASAFLHAQGIRYTFSRLTRFNIASRRAHAHLGWRCSGRAVFFQAGRLEMMAATLPPYVGVTWSSTQRIALRLNANLLSAGVGPGHDASRPSAANSL